MKCKHCNAEIPNDSNFCEFCGKKVKKRMPWWGILLIVLGIIFQLIFVFGVVMYYVNDMDYEEPNTWAVENDNDNVVEEVEPATEEVAAPADERNYYPADEEIY